MLADAPTTPGIDSDVTIEWQPDAARLRTTLTFAGPLDIPNGKCWIDDTLSVDDATGTVVASGEPALQIGFVFGEVDIADADGGEAEVPCPAADRVHEFAAGAAGRDGRRCCAIFAHAAVSRRRCPYNRAMCRFLIRLILPEAGAS